MALNKAFRSDNIPVPADLRPVMKHLLTHPNIASKRWVYTQYDSMVGTINMSTNKPSDASLVDVRGTNKALALSVDCNSRYVYSDPEQGCAIAVAEAARNIVCSGGEPSAVTNCLNFGNPYNPEVYWQFVHAIKGMSKACTALETPVTGGNVSFYNQSKNEQGEVPVFPTPTIGMVGIVPDKKRQMTLDFKGEGDIIFLLGESQDDIASSEYLYSYCGVKNSPAPHFHLEEELAVQTLVKNLIAEGLVQSAHDVSDGGLFVTLMESSFPRGIGFRIDTDEEFRKDAYLFGEAQSRVVVTVAPEKLEEFVEMVSASEVDFTNLGETGGNIVMIDEEEYGQIADFKALYDHAIHELMTHE
jgi:phosphoribosylformylglycinamidine synthase